MSLPHSPSFGMVGKDAASLEAPFSRGPYLSVVHWCWQDSTAHHTENSDS